MEFKDSKTYQNLATAFALGVLEPNAKEPFASFIAFAFSRPFHDIFDQAVKVQRVLRGVFNLNVSGDAGDRDEFKAG